jgi:serine/threonine protein kinase
MPELRNNSVRPPPIPPRPCDRELKTRFDYYYLINCLIDKKFGTVASKSGVVNIVNSLDKIEQLRNFFTDFKKIGSESAYGTVYSACVKGLQEKCFKTKSSDDELKVAIKFQKLTPTEQSDFLNENYIEDPKGIWNEIYISYKLSLSVQNDAALCCALPNFPILYRTFFSKLCFQDTVEKIRYEDDPEYPCERVPCVMIVNELSDGDFGDFFPPPKINIDLKSFESAYLQIYMAIIAMQLNKVVHNDLYPKNILYTRVPDEYWRYDIIIDGKTTSFILPTNGYLFKICDFGKSSINSEPFYYDTDITTITFEAVNNPLNSKFLNIYNGQYKNTLDFVEMLKVQFKEYLANEKKPNEKINQYFKLRFA